MIGQVRSGVFAKRIRASRHLLRKPPAICFDLESLVEAESAGAGVVRVEDVESGRVYAAMMSDVRRRGFLLNRGHGDQWAVPLPVWSANGGRDAPVQPELPGVRGYG